MDIARYVAIGDRHLANQYYLDVHPTMMLFLAFGLLAPPWLGAWYAGPRGLAWAVTLQACAIFGMYGYVRLRLPSDSDFAFDVAILNFRASILALVGGSVSIPGVDLA